MITTRIEAAEADPWLPAMLSSETLIVATAPTITHHE